MILTIGSPTLSNANWALGPSSPQALYLKARSPMTDAEIDRVMWAVKKIAKASGVDPILMLALSAHETGGWTSRKWLQNWNPAGIGVYSDATEGEVFASPIDGFQCLAGLILGYAWAKNAPEVPVYQDRLIQYTTLIRPRLEFVRGVADQLGEMSRRWAADPDHAGKVVRTSVAMAGPPVARTAFDSEWTQPLRHPDAP